MLLNQMMIYDYVFYDTHFFKKTLISDLKKISWCNAVQQIQGYRLVQKDLCNGMQQCTGWRRLSFWFATKKKQKRIEYFVNVNMQSVRHSALLLDKCLTNMQLVRHSALLLNKSLTFRINHGRTVSKQLWSQHNGKFTKVLLLLLNIRPHFLFVGIRYTD